MQLLFSVAVFTSLLSSAVVTAAPTRNGDIADVMGLRGEAITECDLSQVNLPASPSGRQLAGPDSGLKLTRVVLGRGIQSYTCADFNESTLPRFTGADATLYDASCLAAKQPDFFNGLPNSFVSLPATHPFFSSESVKKLTAKEIITGHHSFNPEATTPIFDFRLQQGQTDIFTGTRNDSVSAPQSASRGAPGEENGPVDWLRISAIPDRSVGLELAYRIFTAGGRAPATCKGLTRNDIEVQYAAQYWFYG